MAIKMNYIAGIFCVLSILSCSTTNRLYNKRENKKLVSQLFESNGNAFYVRSTNIVISFVWSYSDKEVFIYKLSKNKIIDKRVLLITGKPNWHKQPSNEELYELDTCMELDGDMFGYKLKIDGKVEEQDLPINLECFTRGKFKSDFINKVVKDINVYQIRW